MTNTIYLVRRPFRAGGKDYQTGDHFDAAGAIHLRKLIEQRYLTDDPVEVPEAKTRSQEQPKPAETLSKADAVPAPKKRGRPKKVKPNESDAGVVE